MTCTHFATIRNVKPSADAYYPTDPWGWCYIEEVMLDFTGKQTTTGPGMFVLLRGRVAITRKNTLDAEAPMLRWSRGCIRG